MKGEAKADSPQSLRLFVDVSAESGIAAQRGAGLGVVASDLTDDGWMDIFVANDGHANFLWVNQKNGTFQDEAVLRGVAWDSAGQSQGSMGVAVADLDQNGLPDLAVSNLDGESNASTSTTAHRFAISPHTGRWILLRGHTPGSGPLWQISITMARQISSWSTGESEDTRRWQQGTRNAPQPSPISGISIGKHSSCSLGGRDCSSSPLIQGNSRN